MATTEIPAESVYVSVPERVIIDEETARASALGPLFGELDVELRGSRGSPLGQFEVIRLFLLAECLRGDESPWAPYLRVLPRSFADVPVFWPDADIASLEGTGLAAATCKRRADLDRAWEEFSRHVGSAQPEVFGQVDRAAFEWASMVLDTRSIWWQGKRHLVPMLDLVNCSEGPGPEPLRTHATVLNARTRSAETRASKGFAEGEQIFENYGQPNATYLLYHGFVLEQNSHDAVEIEIGGRRRSLGPRRLGAFLGRHGELRDELAARIEELLAQPAPSPPRAAGEHATTVAQFRASRRRTLGELQRRLAASP